VSWRLFASTFGAIFLAELGDKTQLATFSLSASSDSRWTIFLAAASALVATTALGVLAGEAVGRLVPAIWIERAAGVAFIAMGVILLVGRR
jgi:Ca2+/H+ antiporter, TMEM165/GDT1 family